MKARYDPEAKALYIYTNHPDAGKPGSVAGTRKIVRGEEWLMMDYGYDGEILGIEALLSKPLEILGRRQA